MSAPYVPAAVSAGVTAHLTGYSPRRVSRLVRDGLLPTRDGKVLLAGIEQLTGRAVDAGAYLAAKAHVTNVYLKRVGSARVSAPDDRPCAA
jgi:hypothetical protein